MEIDAAVTAYSQGRNGAPPRRIGQRYTAGRFLPEPGNTVVCHLDRTQPAHAAVLEARRRVMALPEAGRLLFTPEESLHMTLFEGIIDTRRTADAWPAGVDRTAAVEEVTDLLRARLEAHPPLLPFAVRVAGIGPGGLRLEGATAQDEARMRAARDGLTGPFGFRHAGHDAYRFHMTFAYPVAWLPDDLVPVWAEAMRGICADLQSAAPVLPLRAPAFCSFGDMTHFEELLVLAP